MSELNTNKTPDAYRRNLQRTYVNQLISFTESDDKNVKQSDISAYARAELLKLLRTLELKVNANSHPHWIGLQGSIAEVLDVD